MTVSTADRAFYEAWTILLAWMRTYAEVHAGVVFEKESDFPDYIYRMERPFDLPTTIMSASLSDARGKPVLLANASPRHAVFKEVVLHPFESHTYRKLKLAPGGTGLAEGKRSFSRDMLERLANDLFGHLRRGLSDEEDLLRAARGGLCGACSWARLVRSGRGSVFVRCSHPDLPKYLPQPILRCHGHASRPDEEHRADPDPTA